MKTTIVALSVFALFAGCANEPRTEAASSTPGPAGPIKVGSTMPEYTAQRLGGGSFELGEASNEVVLLNIWATWCGPCRVEIPDLIALQKAYGDKGFNVVGVSIDGPNTAAQIEPFVRSMSINYPIALDPKATIADIFETSVIPTSALIDRQGKVVWIDYGIVRATDPELREAIERALAG